MKVLIVEDDQAIAQMYQMKCEFSGITAKMAGNGKEALDQLQTYEPEAILLDIMMPIMDGVEFMYKFRANEKYKNIPVLILTNLGAEEVPESMWGTGIAGYIIKANTTPSEVINKIKEIVENSAPATQDA